LFANAVLFFHALCSVLWEFVNSNGDDVVYQLQREQKKAQEGFGHTKTKCDNFSVPLELLELMKMSRRF